MIHHRIAGRASARSRTRCEAAQARHTGCVPRSRMSWRARIDTFSGESSRFVSVTSVLDAPVGGDAHGAPPSIPSATTVAMGPTHPTRRSTLTAALPLLQDSTGKTTAWDQLSSTPSRLGRQQAPGPLPNFELPSPHTRIQPDALGCVCCGPQRFAIVTDLFGSGRPERRRASIREPAVPVRRRAPAARAGNPEITERDAHALPRPKQPRPIHRKVRGSHPSPRIRWSVGARNWSAAN